MDDFLRYCYKSEIHIQRSREDIWKILADPGSYPKWNPFTIKIESDWKVGGKIRLTVNMNSDRKPIIQTEYITRFDPPQEMAWGMNWGFLLKAQRTQRLTRVADSETHYFNEDIIEGLLSPVVHLLYGKSIQKGFEAVATSLKKHLETQ